MNKIIFFDMDGTLLYSENNINPIINDETKRILKQVQEKGHLLFIASGRPYAFLAKNVTDFHFDGYVLANGAVALYQGQRLHHIPMERNLVEYVVSEFEKRKIEYILQTEYYSYLAKENKLMENFYDHCSVNYDYIIRDFKSEDYFEQVVKIEMLPQGTDNIAFCRQLEGEHFHLMGQPPYTFELYSKKMSKAVGIKKVLEELHIPIENSYAFGDGENDIEMLQTVGYGIAMGNAGDEVKSSADDVCLPVNENGVAKKLAELFL